MPDTKKILKVLRDEQTLQTRHCRLLETQQRALLACDRKRFHDTQTEHALLLAQLEVQAEARQAALLGDDGKPCLLSAIVEDLPERSRRPILNVRDTLRLTLERIQELSRQNERLINNELEYIAFTLDLFVEAGRKADILYGGRSLNGCRLLLDRLA
ncbi:hypothetical protein CCAX7_003510 [Capsulimonas corticalis]|uniref:Uncharacterized protein n=1 Tax=Capsulimonas corticalis TaxID=2219043 RepID=A0A402CS95_9BACT|nr:flagellar export chaperone FlgN [Capsulimonas corticalis]BDI28300.1 hypothetical protein CCAX7_003510 [Capsulimonas corticalis]